MPIPGSVDPVYGLSTIDICTQTVTDILEDGWRSFPSGHSSSTFSPALARWPGLLNSHEVAFSGLGFLAFYLSGKLHIFDTRGHAVSLFQLNLALLALQLNVLHRAKSGLQLLLYQWHRW